VYTATAKQVSGSVTFELGEVVSVCDASKSAYWNGLSNIRASNGELLSEFHLIAEGSGMDYRFASPLSPAPVPEPASWALLLSGFVILGSTSRKRHQLKIEKKSSCPEFTVLHLAFRAMFDSALSHRGPESRSPQAGLRQAEIGKRQREHS
jgi:hypothetical protein